MKPYIFIALLLLGAVISISAQKVTDIRKVDFLNYTHQFGERSVKLKNGLQDVSCSRDKDGIPSGDVWSMERSAIVFGDLDNDGIAEAMMSAVANVCDGNMITDEAVVVYKLEKGRIVRLPGFDYFREPCETGKPCELSRTPGVSLSYDNVARALVVETRYGDDNDAICCPSYRNETWFKWTGTNFTELKRSKITKVEE